MRKTLAYIALIALTSATGCFYAPDEEVFKDVAEADPVGMISLSEYDDGDTIVLYTAANFSFKVGINQGDIKEVSVLLGSSELYKGGGRSGVFSINGEDLKTGLYELQIEFITSSGTGSLLDKLGRENFKLWRKWIVKIDVDPPPAPVLEIVSNTDFLTVKWQPYVKENFVSYELNVNSGGRRIVINDPQITSWVDSSFLWGYRGFEVTVNTNLHSRTSEAKVAKYPQELQFAYRAEDSTALFTWRKSHFPGAFKEVEILENLESRIKITSPADTTLELKMNVIMGRRLSVYFYLRGRHGDIPVFSENYLLDNPLGLEKFENRTTFYYSVGIGGLLGYDHTEGQLNVYDADLNIIGVHGSIPGSLHIPSLGPYIYFRMRSEVIQRDFVSKAEVSVAATKRNGTAATILALGAGANGNVVFTYIDDTDVFWKEYYTKIYNINTGKLIRSTKTEYDPKSGNYQAPFLSDDGRFLSYSNSRVIYAIEADTVRRIGSIPLTGTFVGFREDNSEQIFFSTASTIHICSTWDFSVLKTMPMPESGYIFKNYDPATKNILLAKPSGSKAYLINVDTDEVKALPVGGDNYVFFNGILFEGTGYYLRVF